MDLDGLRVWREDLRHAAASALLGFETRYGYPPGENGISPPDPAGTARLAAVDTIPQDLLLLYRAVGGIDLPDVGNGFFLHTASHIARFHESRQLRHVRGGHHADVLVFASDGGGTQYALDTPTGVPVYRLPPAAVIDGTYTSDDPQFGPAAPDLATFLGGLLNAVEAFAASGTPPQLQETGPPRQGPRACQGVTSQAGSSEA
ncbi:hypothetical protein ACGFI9_30475 [Micromonospora sp. NPDC048930]|uniref:hypothetical protein n=1 Tax=Micromonospora sp. NPDC048930 TaxID=3364261 RepID=UPI0037218A29